MPQKYINIAGSFECVVVKPEVGWFGESKEKQTPFIRVPVVVSEGPYAGECATWSGWLSEAAFDGTIARLAKVFGFDGDLNALYEGRVTLVGLPCNITTEIETYEGKERCKIAWLNPPGGGGAEPMEAAKVNSLLGRLQSRSKAVAKAAKSAKSSEGGSAGSTALPGDGESSPFAQSDDVIP